jgi:hypothetical protein
VRTRKKLIALALGLAAIAVFVALALRERQPTYHGQTLSYWVSDYKPPTSNPHEGEADEAIKYIGTNAIPFLLHWIACKPTPVRNTTAGLIRKIPYDWRRGYFNEQSWFAYQAADAFQALGTQATEAVPALTLLATNATDPEVAATAANSWRALRPGPIPDCGGTVARQKARPARPAKTFETLKTTSITVLRVL